MSERKKSCISFSTTLPWLNLYEKFGSKDKNRSIFFKNLTLLQFVRQKGLRMKKL